MLSSHPAFQKHGLAVLNTCAQTMSQRGTGVAVLQMIGRSELGGVKYLPSRLYVLYNCYRREAVVTVTRALILP